MSLTKSNSQFIDNTLIDLGRQFRWSYLPPLMIYVAAGISGLPGIAGVFFIKDYPNLSAAFLAGLVFASFTNLALSANALGTKYLNEIFTITRAVKDKVTDVVLSTADYSELGLLLIIVTVMTLCIPIATVWMIQQSKFKTDE